MGRAGLVRLLAIAIAGLLLFAGCRSAEVRNFCLEAEGNCPPCASNAECVFAGNSCTETVFCVRSGSAPAVIQIGCSEALEYSWPDPEECACIDSVCRYSDE